MSELQKILLTERIYYLPHKDDWEQINMIITIMKQSNRYKIKAGKQESEIKKILQKSMTVFLEDIDTMLSKVLRYNKFLFTPG